MKEIFMLRARWRELETEPRTRLNGHEGETPIRTSRRPDGPPRQFPTLHTLRLAHLELGGVDLDLARRSSSSCQPNQLGQCRALRGIQALSRTGRDGKRLRSTVYGYTNLLASFHSFKLYRFEPMRGFSPFLD